MTSPAGRHLTAIFALAALLAGLTVATTAGADPTITVSSNQETLQFTTPGTHLFTVPAGVSSLHVVAVGAHGGAGPNGSSPGGAGAKITGDVSVTPGQTLYVEVGSAGTDAPSIAPSTSGGSGGANGGGAGGTGGANTFASGAGGGGGASALGTSTSSSAGLIVAAGGGGGGAEVLGSDTGGSAAQSGSFDADGGAAGLDGTSPGSTGDGSGGGGGSSTAGGLVGAAGTFSGFTSGAPGGAGALAFGGRGGNGAVASPDGGEAGGGGGGGYYGGGGGGGGVGGSGLGSGGGGGGGSSFADPSLVTSPSIQAPTGGPMVSISFGVPTASGSPSSLTFAQQPLDTISPTQTVTVTNSGAAPLAVSGFTLGGANPDDFIVDLNRDTCPSSVAVGDSCRLSVRFAPQVASSIEHATLNLQTNAPGTQPSISLTGASGTLPQGTAGTNGTNGATGPAGPAGPAGEAGDAALIECKIRPAKKRKRRKRPATMTCQVKRLQPGQVVVLNVMQAGKVYASGQVRVRGASAKVALTPLHRLKRGRYRVVLKLTRAGRLVSEQSQPLVIR